MIRHTSLGLLACGLMFACLGCSESTGDQRYDISGTVTFQGNPVQEGSISFVPQGAEKKASGFATIENGKFDTSLGGRGHAGGPHEVQITAASSDGQSRPPFPTYKKVEDLPNESTSLDFDVSSGK